MRSLIAAAVLLVACSSTPAVDVAGKDREIAALRAQLAANEPPAPAKVAPAAVPDMSAGAAPGRPYVKGEWCVFDCFRMALGAELTTPTFSQWEMRMGAVSIAGTACADASCMTNLTAQLQTAIGCQQVDDKREACETGIKLPPDQAKETCNLIAMESLAYCCEKPGKILGKKPCALFKKKGLQGVLDLPKDKRTALLGDTSK